jgi:predicted outer membrane protein
MSTITFISTIPKIQIQEFAKNNKKRVTDIMNEALELYMSKQLSSRRNSQLKRSLKLQKEFDDLLKNVSIPNEMYSLNIDDELAKEFSKK